MKKNASILFFLILFFQMNLGNNEQKVKEFVEVINIEVPVRVFHKGTPVDSLTRKDFILYEGKKQQKIHGFYLIRKKIKTQEIGLDIEREKIYKPRYFVLVFRITDYPRELEEGLNYILNSILNEKDKVLVFINDKTIFLGNISDKAKAHSIIENFLKEQSMNAKKKIYHYFSNLEKLLKILELGEFNIHNVDKLVIFLRQYVLTWTEYKRKYLIPDLDTYYNFAKFLENINMEKWVINFYQIEKFPRLKFRKELEFRNLIGELQLQGAEYINVSRILSRLLFNLEKEFNVAQDFPSIEVSKLFYKVNATFHSVFFTTYKDMLNENLELKKIRTDIENSLQEITRKTGGELITSNKISTALNKVVEKEDICYMLTYSPENPDKVGRIKVAVKDKNYDVYYDDNFRADYIKEYLEKKRVEMPQVQLKELTFKDRTLSMQISDFLLKKEEGRQLGKLTVDVQIKTPQGKVLMDQDKVITAEEDTVSISLTFKWLKKGSYDILVDVKDLFSGKSAVDFLQVTIE